MEKSFDQSNLKLYKSQSKDYLRALRHILSTLVRTMPREEVIKVLKDKKIIKDEYFEKDDKFYLVERK